MITCHSVFNVWPMTTLLFPVWPGDAERCDMLEMSTTNRTDWESTGRRRNYEARKEVISITERVMVHRARDQDGHMGCVSCTSCMVSLRMFSTSD